MCAQRENISSNFHEVFMRPGCICVRGASLFAGASVYNARFYMRVRAESLTQGLTDEKI
jgi:hypothetical protein